MRGASDPVARGTELNAVPGIRGSLTRGLTSRRTARRQSEAEMPWLLRLWRQRMERPVEATPALRKRTARRVSRTRNIQTLRSPASRKTRRATLVFSWITLRPAGRGGKGAYLNESPEIAKRLSGVQRWRPRCKLDPGQWLRHFRELKERKANQRRHPPTDPGLEPGEDRRTQLKSLRPTIPWVLRSSRRMTRERGRKRKRKPSPLKKGRGQ